MQPTKEGKISVSVMCSDLMNLERDIKQLERNGVDYLHVDVMDAHFVPNLTFGVDFIAAMHRVTKLPLDIHLMVEHPLPIMEAMDIRPGDRISLHVELGEQLHELAKAVRARGAHFGLVVNPSTPVEALTPYLDEIEWVILMLVQPGFAGAKLIDGILDKVAAARRFLDEHGHPRNGNFGRRVGKLRTRPPHARHGRLDLRRRDGRHLPQGNDPRRKYPALPTGNKIARR